MPKPSARAAYVCLVITVGVLAVGDAAAATRWTPLDPRWIILLVLTLIGAVATLRMRAAPVTFSISDTFTFTTLLLLGPSPATITAALEALTISCFLSPGQRRPSRVAFNVAAVGLAMWVAGLVLVTFEGGSGPGSLVDHPARLSFATAAAVSTYFLLNTWIVALAIALEQNKPVARIWRTYFLHLGMASAAGAYTALLLALLAPRSGLLAFLLLAPMPLVLYASGRIWLGRMNDRVAYLDTMNRHHRATVEALAHAVDAKDQVTHGHIRRVQAATLQLARALGCTDEGELHAIEAASLLHDIGKLAIPEHILNKPGPLTVTEYATVKEHARIGADILSEVEFPYPVVPIVRHHHENWDGTGYPDGLSGERIPLGARILAIVDCFDALTSDRPYRRAVPNREAIAILRARKGTMYDPDIVERFIGMTPSGEPSAAADSRPKAAAAESAGETWVASSDFPALAALAGPVLLVACRDAGADAGVVFTHLAEADVLVPLATVGLAPAMLMSLHMHLGERLSGWVAANREPQRESDARLDLLDHDHRLKTAVSLPILRGDALFGVMTLYATLPGRFDAAALQRLEVLVSAIGELAARTPLPDNVRV